MHSILLPVVIGIVVLFLIFIPGGFKLIAANQVGILIRKIGGGPLPPGHIVALKGENGVQAEVLMPGFYWKLPLFWSFKIVPTTIISPTHIGVIEAIDGQPLAATRLLGDRVECNAFQNAKAFLEGGGSRGPQVDILRPGTYRINTTLFKVTDQIATIIQEQKIGIITALDGKPLPSDYIIAPKANISETDHKYFQDGQAFINGGGFRGTQQDTLQPGEYYLNPLLFSVMVKDTFEVPPGYVAVIRSNVGIELDRSSSRPAPSTGEGALSGPVTAGVETLLITDKLTRGIWKDPIAPGRDNLNTIAYTPYLVPTSAVTIDWADEGKIGTEVRGVTDPDKGVLFNFNPLKVTSQDGFLLQVNVRMVIRIQSSNAAYTIARFGSVQNLIDQIVHPLIDSSFRNKAGGKNALDFVQSRMELQADALAHAQEKFAEYNVEAQNLLIAYIDVPPDLLATQTKKQIAIQQQAQFEQEAKAQASRIAVMENSARADKQKDVIDALLQVDIATNNASARKAQGIGEAAYQEMVNAAAGKGLAEGYKAQVDALGPEGTALVNVIKSLADEGLSFVPNVYVNGGGNGGLADMIGTWTAVLAQQAADRVNFSTRRASNGSGSIWNCPQASYPGLIIEHAEGRIVSPSA